MSTCQYPGKISWIETNSPLCDRSMRFYRDMFCWQVKPIHVDPFGLMPGFCQDDIGFGHCFMAMGRFAQSRWVLFLAADLAWVEAHIQELGGALVGKQDFPGWSQTLTVADPRGNHLNLIQLEGGELPEPTPPGMPIAFKLWLPHMDDVKQFYADLFGGTWEQLDKNCTISVRGKPRFHLEDIEDPKAEPIWVPYFHSRSVGADSRRATTFGAVPRDQKEPLGKSGLSSLFVDPAGSFFGLLTPR